jgi:hypothetical protein
MTASVVKGTISETDPTKVVFPAPKPPATTIFTDVVAELATGRLESELAKSTEHPFQEREIRPVIQVVRLVDADERLIGHVSDEHAGHAERDVQGCGYLRHRADVLAEAGDGLPFWAESDRPLES